MLPHEGWLHEVIESEYNTTARVYDRRAGVLQMQPDFLAIQRMGTSRAYGKLDEGRVLEQNPTTETP